MSFQSSSASRTYVRSISRLLCPLVSQILNRFAPRFAADVMKPAWRLHAGDRDKLLKEANDTISLHLRLCTESRHIHGSRAADELWRKLGLPKVPAMDEAYRDLFNWQAPSSSFSSERMPQHEQSPSVAVA